MKCKKNVNNFRNNVQDRLCMVQVLGWIERDIRDWFVEHPIWFSQINTKSTVFEHSTQKQHQNTQIEQTLSRNLLLLRHNVKPWWFQTKTSSKTGGRDPADVYYVLNNGLNLLIYTFRRRHPAHLSRKVVGHTRLRLSQSRGRAHFSISSNPYHRNGQSVCVFAWEWDGGIKHRNPTCARPGHMGRAMSWLIRYNNDVSKWITLYVFDERPFVSHWCLSSSPSTDVSCDISIYTFSAVYWISAWPRLAPPALCTRGEGDNLILGRFFTQSTYCICGMYQNILEDRPPHPLQSFAQREGKLLGGRGQKTLTLEFLPRSSTHGPGNVISRSGYFPRRICRT